MPAFTTSELLSTQEPFYEHARLEIRSALGELLDAEQEGKARLAASKAGKARKAGKTRKARTADPFSSWLLWADPLIVATEITQGRKLDRVWLKQCFDSAVSAVDFERRRGPNGNRGMIIMGKDPFGYGLPVPRKAVTPEESRARPVVVGSVESPLDWTGPRAA